jgi:ATP-dependent RNA helicase DeaD
MPARIERLARQHLRDAVRIAIERPFSAADQPGHVRQSAYLVRRAHKPAALGRLLDVESPGAALVFCRTRDEVDQLTESLNGRGYRAEALHGGMGQEQRDRVMNRLRGGTADLLVATDVAARGLDVEHLTHVVNYDVPSAPEAYVHRIGRVGRGGRDGVALTLVEPREHRMLKTIERTTRQRVALERLPSVADLRARRLELTRAALEETLLEDDLDRFRVVVETLSEEFDVMEVALAAVKLAHRAGAAEADEEAEIPEVAPRADRADRADRPAERERTPRRPDARRQPTGGMARLFVGAGRSAGIRPQDLVGAITGESHITGKDIGAIQISDRFSLVEVPDKDADQVIAALKAGTIKGKKTVVRREKF